MRALSPNWLCATGLAVSLLRAVAQVPTPAATSTASPAPGTQQQMDLLTRQLDSAEERLRQSQKEIEELQAQIRAMRQALAATQQTTGTVQTTAGALGAAASTSATQSIQPPLNERVDVLEAEVKQHEQGKVESASRYPVRLTGLLLFNSYLVAGGVDNLNDPTIAYPLTAGAASRRLAANFSQTILGIQATGPHVFGGVSSGEVNFDFSGGAPYANYGTSGGTIRLRTGALRLNWDRDTVEAGYVEPLISPLSPTSYATVAEPGMSWAGNLWIWSPQLSYTHRFGELAQPHLIVQAGLWDPSPAGTNGPDVYRVASPSERSAQPGYETRFAFERGAADAENALQIGLGGYYSRQTFTNRNGDSWAATTDWKIPLGHHFQWSGEAYRGRSLAGLGGTVFKDIVSGTNPVTGASTFHLLNGAGGWTQAKVRLTQILETNGSFGIDTGFSRDFRSLNGITPTSIAREQVAVWNLIYTPRSYFVISPEYRFIRTWPISSAASSAHIFTLSLGFKF